MASQLKARQLLGVAYYGALIVLITMIMFEFLPRILPDLIAGRIARNSEGILLVLILSVWIQFLRPRLQVSPREWPITVTVGLACLGIGLLLFFTDPINRVKTLNETFLAASLLIPYVQFARPLPRLVPLAGCGGGLLLVLLGNQNATITLMAEALGALIMTTIALDIVDKGILDDTARTRLPVRLGWYAFLLVGPAVFWRTDNGASLDGGVSEFITYAGRTTEVFLCLLALELYFAVGLGRTGAHAAAPPTTPAFARRSPASSAAAGPG